MKDTYNFKMGDKVKISEKKVKKLNNGTIPDWFTNEILTITKRIGNIDNNGVFVPTLDDNGFPLVNVKGNSSTLFGYGTGNSITTYYLESTLREQRKLKLEKLKKINDSRTLSYL